ncbi:phosphohistidine phosphatase, SixA [Hyperthermus butylicus DSM 5456]|uniref:Phosphohistidine phosphatase, SixA n=1 Tax=Hyperthermus butylicus (strain DSM 5456 / JCM 9403 / PLM1-5) TaxID=415426 RepID=A2BJH1_HYPBU|nr:phosphohistidine phosphatase, SixA [Hyperthermus butylicus DSM 5456]
MAVYIFMRHGEAVGVDVAGSDEERWLTERGREDVELVAMLLPVRPRVVYSSPLRRARETAEIVARLYGAKVTVAEQLEPGRFSVEALQELGPEPDSVLVGHAPSMWRVVSALIGGGDVVIPAGGAAIVEAEELERGMARLLELVTPRAARTALETICPR